MKIKMFLKFLPNSAMKKLNNGMILVFPKCLVDSQISKKYKKKINEILIFAIL